MSDKKEKQKKSRIFIENYLIIWKQIVDITNLYQTYSCVFIFDTVMSRKSIVTLKKIKNT